MFMLKGPSIVQISRDSQIWAPKMIAGWFKLWVFLSLGIKLTSPPLKLTRYNLRIYLSNKYLWNQSICQFLSLLRYPCRPCHPCWSCCHYRCHCHPYLFFQIYYLAKFGGPSLEIGWVMTNLVQVKNWQSQTNWETEKLTGFANI